jgi:purine catabolism regulator
MNSASIHDLLRLALPLGTQLLTPASGLRRQVQHVTSLRATLPAFVSLGGGELVLVSVDDVLVLHEDLTLTQLVRRLSDVDVVAIAVAGPVEDDAAAMAADVELVLLQLPAGANLRGVERDTGYLLDNPKLQIERRAAQLYTELTQQVARGNGIGALLQVVHAATGRSAAFYDAAGRLRAEHHAVPAQPGFPARCPRAGRATADGQTFLFKTVGDEGSKLGFVGLCGPTLDAWDDTAADQAVAALRLELTKQQAVEAVEARVGGDLLQTIMSGSPPDMVVLREQAGELGYDLRQPHVALLIAPGDSNTTTSMIRDRLEREIRLQQQKAPHIARDSVVLCMYPDGAGPEKPTRLLQKLAKELPIAAGISTPAPTAAGWQRAYAEAEQALALGRHLFGPRSLTPFSDLQVYRLLFELRTSSALWDFYRSILGALVDYDREHDSALLETLEGYFAAQCNLSQAARLLQIHRNTLLYRLRRIGDIAGIDMERAEDALALQVALKAHRVLLAPGATNR